MPRSPRRPPAHTVPLGDRPPDDGVIDYVLVRQALTGWASSAAQLTKREVCAAVHLGTARPYSKSAAQLADLLLLHQKQITDFRGQPWPGEVFSCPTDPADLTTDPLDHPVFQRDAATLDALRAA